MQMLTLPYNKTKGRAGTDGRLGDDTVGSININYYRFTREVVSDLSLVKRNEKPNIDKSMVIVDEWWRRDDDDDDDGIPSF